MLYSKSSLVIYVIYSSVYTSVPVQDVVVSFSERYFHGVSDCWLIIVFVFLFPQQVEYVILLMSGIHCF